MIYMSDRYIKNVGSLIDDSRNAIKQSDKKIFNIILDNYKIVFKKRRNGSMGPDSVIIDAFCVNPEFKAFGNQKVSVIQPIAKSKHPQTQLFRLDYAKTVKSALDKIQKHLGKEKIIFSPIAVELDKYANNFPVLTFLNNIFAKSVKI